LPLRGRNAEVSERSAACGGYSDSSAGQRSVIDAGVRAKESTGHRNRMPFPTDLSFHISICQKTGSEEPVFDIFTYMAYFAVSFSSVAVCSTLQVSSMEVNTVV